MSIMNIDIKKATKKWTPVLDSLKIKDEYREKVAEYAEYHSINNIQLNQNYLPISFKLFGELKYDI